jgi:site-specific DNA-methyltransferase (adenine-specific)
MPNQLFYGDNLQVLRDSIATESVDLVYLDPPFNSQANYNVLFKAPTGQKSQAQIEAFEDTWHWNEQAEKSFDEVMHSGNTDVAEMLNAMRSFLKENDMMAYLTMMAVRLLELHRVLKPTGSLYLHCDPTASHYLKILLDGVFSPGCFRNEIIWRRTGSHNARRSFGPIHDTILFYSKSDDYPFTIVKRPYMRGHVTSRYTLDETGKYKFTSGGNILTGAGATAGESGATWHGFNPSAKNRHWAIPGFLAEQMPPEFQLLGVLAKLDALYEAGLVEIVEGNAWPTPVRYLGDDDGQPIQDIWAAQPYTEGTVYGTNEIIDADVAWLGTTAPERLGYPTQKPVGLLERILKASSKEGDIVLDPFCGCGTTIHAAEKLKRTWIGIDVTHLAISLIEKRLKDAFPGTKFEVHGTPKDLDGAKALAELDKYQFQWWAVSLVDAIPYGGKKKGADSGIDGFIYFKPEGKVTEKAIVSVKGGNNVNVAMIRDLAHVVDSEKAKIGVFITLAKPTGPMLTEAVKAGYFQTAYKKYPKIQILTIEELFSGKKPDIPLVDPSGFKKAEVVEAPFKQEKLF